MEDKLGRLTESLLLLGPSDREKSDLRLELKVSKLENDLLSFSFSLSSIGSDDVTVERSGGS